MIGEVNDMRDFRPLAKNIDNARIETYIGEAERLDIIPAIGAAEYRRLDDGTGLTEDERLLLNGGYYTNYAGVEMCFAGLKAAICYLAYARFLRNNPINVTPFGVVIKESSESQPASQQMIAAAAKDAEQVGREYLTQTMEYWRNANRLPHSAISSGRKRFVGIG